MLASRTPAQSVTTLQWTVYIVEGATSSASPQGPTTSHTHRTVYPRSLPPLADAYTYCTV